MTPGHWYSLDEIYRIVEDRAPLEADDLLPDAPGSKGIRWQRNVRNVLQKAKHDGRLIWDIPGSIPEVVRRIAFIVAS